ncbi:MAG: hypothetical protein FGM15_05045 [Chthoniobacterales bacterium]|nr:hypothetical protein [Chthoniobacterales bacterium]
MFPFRLPCLRPFGFARFMTTKIRNKIIFLTCIFAFLGLGVLIYREWVVQRPFAVVLFVADNLSPSQLAAGRIFTGGSGFRYGLESMPHVALVTPRSRDYAVADSAAAATALATGQEVNRGALGLSPEGQSLESLLSLARRQGRATGLVSNTPLTDPAPAAFYAHATDTSDTTALAVQLVDEAPMDVMLGGGASQLAPAEQGGTRKDGRDLLLDMRQRGFDIVRTRAELENTPGWRSPQVFGVFSDGDLAFVEDQPRYASQPRLADLVSRAIGLLQYNRKGYFLVVNAGLSGRAADLGRGETLLREIGALDEAVAAALQYAGEDALVMVAGLANSGGLQLNGFSFAPDRGIAVLGTSAAGIPALSWATGPSRTQTKEGSTTAEVVASPTERPAPVAGDSLVFASGPRTDSVRGFLTYPQLNEVLRKSL